MRAEGRSIRQIAATLGVSAMTVQRAVAPAGIVILICIKRVPEDCPFLLQFERT
jgi:hypothetical protein